MRPWLNWIEHLTTDQEVWGSNPYGRAIFLFGVALVIFGIGIDIVKISRIENSISSLGDKFLQKIFTPAEISYCQTKSFPAIHFAARFAAKEAFSKAIKTGFSQGVIPKQIEVAKTENDCPYLILHGKTKEICDALGVKNLHLSISHEKEIALAQVVAES